MFEKTMVAGWGDMDFNSHMRNTAYLDKSADLRMLYFSEHGFPMREFIKRRMGPVIRQDTLDYFGEINLLEEFRINLSLAGLAENGSHFRMQNEIWRADGKLAARVTSTGGWLDLFNRKLIPAPKELLEAMQQLPRVENFEVLPSSA